MHIGFYQASQIPMAIQCCGASWKEKVISNSCEEVEHHTVAKKVGEMVWLLIFSTRLGYHNLDAYANAMRIAT